MWIHKIRNNFHISTFLNNFFTGKCKKILFYVIGQDFHHYLYLLEFSIARSTRERNHVADIGHACYKQ